MNAVQPPLERSAETTVATCPQCGSAAVEAMSVRTALWQGDRLVVLEGLPALACRHCHEQFYDDATATMLDLLRGDGFPAEMATRSLAVEVFDFGNLLGGRLERPRGMAT
jgi:YgiT-type zinc finger domain-containing protein